MTIHDFLDACTAHTGTPPRKVAGGYMVRCPAHQDRNPSLSVTEGADGRVLLKCHAGCTTEAIVTALGLTMRDLMPPRPDTDRHIVATYDYVDQAGEVAYQVVRFEPKDFRQRRPDGNGGWAWNLKGVDRILYHLPAVLMAVATGDPVWIAEGEKDADTLRAQGVTATTNPQGAGKWSPAYTATLTGADVVIVADADEPGRAHARAIQAALADTADTVTIVEPAHGKDATDHIRAGGTLATFRPLTTTDVPKQEPNGARPTQAAPDTRFRHLSTAELMRLPPPTFVLEPFIVRDALNLLFGPSGTYKTFIALDWALSIAAGTPWYGTPVTQGSVIYIAGEGSGGLPRRLHAWSTARDVALPDAITWIPDSVPLRDHDALTDLEAIIDTQPSPPVLIVVETYARSLAGGNENSSEDAGAMIVGLDRIRIRTGAAILVTHHTGWEHTTRERGWSGLPAALDSSVRVSRPAALNVTLHCQKAKDADEFDDIHLALIPHESSLVIGKIVDPVTARNTEAAAAIIAHVATHPGCSKTDLIKAVPGRAADVVDVIDALAAQMDIRVEKVGQAHRHYPTDSQHRETVGNGTQDTRPDRFPEGPRSLDRPSGNVAASTTQPFPAPPPPHIHRSPPDSIPTPPDEEPFE